MNHSRLHYSSVAIALAAFMTSGCGGQDRWQAGRPTVVESAGAITHGGKPLANAVITLLPVAGSHSAYARSDADGKFTLTTFDANDGAVAGDYKVTVTCIVVENEPNPKDPEHLPPLHHAEYSLIPEDYGSEDKTPLTLTIPETGSDELALTLSGKPTGKLDKGKRKGV
jgi:hypothetical protein